MQLKNKKKILSLFNYNLIKLGLILIRLNFNIILINGINFLNI